MEPDFAVSDDPSFLEDSSPDSKDQEEVAPEEKDASASFPEDASVPESGETSKKEDPQESITESEEEEEDPLSSPAVGSSPDVQKSILLEDSKDLEGEEHSLEDLESDNSSSSSDVVMEAPFLDASYDPSLMEESTGDDLYVLIMNDFQVTHELMVVQIGLLALIFAMFVFRFVYHLISHMVTKFD